MTLPGFRSLAYGLFAVALGAGAALAGDAPPSSTGETHSFCPAGSGRVCWIFGCWCETPSLSYVPAVQCPLPAMEPGTFNIYYDTDSACPTQQAAAPSEAAPPPPPPKKKTHY